MDEQTMDQQISQHDREISSEYANNAYFESSVWDLKILFGQLDQRSTKPLIDWHTAITMPWFQVKLFSYYLQIAIAAYESDNGKIKIPKSVWPLSPSLPAELADNPSAKNVLQFTQELHQRFIEDQQSA
jgi:hypothetical protein